jgi:plasmid stabilization system protein ParE
MSRIVRSAAARRDLVEIIAYYIRQGSPTAGLRFRRQAEATIKRLCGMPGLGTRYKHVHPALAELRYFPLSSPFNAYVVFCQPQPGGITVVRVLHGAGFR